MPSPFWPCPTPPLPALPALLARPRPLPSQALNQAISDLQTFSGGGPNKQSSDHSHTVVDSLRSRLKDATQEFRDVLTTRTDSLKAHRERKSMFSAAPEAGASSRQPLFSQPGACGRV